METQMENAKKIRVLMAIPNLAGGGAERVAINLAKELNQRGFDVLVFAHEKRGNLLSMIDSDINIIFKNDADYSRWHLPGIFFATLKHARKADLLFAANEGRAAFMLIIAGILLRKPLVCWLHNTWSLFMEVTSWRQRMSLNLYDAANSLVACSQGVANSFLSVVNVKPDKVRTIWNGVPVDKIKHLAAEPIDPAFEDIFKVPTVLTAGRIDYQKGQEFLIEAHARLIQQGVKQHLVILGQGPLINERKAQVKALGVENSVFFLGFQKNPYAYMSRATVFALSSRFEGMPLVLAEAMSCGAPIVAVDCASGPSEVLDNGRYGILVATENPIALADGLAKVLSDQQLRDHFIKMSLERCHIFNISNIVEQWKNHLDGVAKRL